MITQSSKVASATLLGFQWDGLAVFPDWTLEIVLAAVKESSFWLLWYLADFRGHPQFELKAPTGLQTLAEQ